MLDDYDYIYIYSFDVYSWTNNTHSTKLHMSLLLFLTLLASLPGEWHAITCYQSRLLECMHACMHVICEWQII